MFDSFLGQLFQAQSGSRTAVCGGCEGKGDNGDKRSQLAKETVNVSNVVSICGVCSLEHCLKCAPGSDLVRCTHCKKTYGACPTKECNTKMMKVVHGALVRRFPRSLIARVVDVGNDGTGKILQEFICNPCREKTYVKVDCGHSIHFQKESIRCSLCERRQCVACPFLNLLCNQCKSTATICATCTSNYNESPSKAGVFLVSVKENKSENARGPWVVDKLYCAASTCLPVTCTFCDAVNYKSAMTLCVGCGLSVCRNCGPRCFSCRKKSGEVRHDCCGTWGVDGPTECSVCHSGHAAELVREHCAYPSCRESTSNPFCCYHKTNRFQLKDDRCQTCSAHFCKLCGSGGRFVRW